ncbi:hypothetical protein [Escherichia phage vB_EcoM_JNE01]|nr:hypothetical protein [Escherichia phage vB_EcoM_JNE01]
MNRQSLPKEHEDNILKRLDEITNTPLSVLEANYDAKFKQFLFNNSEWWYSTPELVCAVNVGVGEYEYAIHYNQKNISIIVDEIAESDKWRDDNSILSMALNYKNDSEYFQDSTIKEIEVSYNVIEKMREFCLYILKVTEDLQCKHPR